MPQATLCVRVQPRARSEMVAGLREGMVVVRVTAPPLDGRANDAVCRLLARVLGVRRSCLTIRQGEQGRDKVITIDGLGQAEADAAIRAAINRWSHDDHRGVA